MRKIVKIILSGFIITMMATTFVSAQNYKIIVNLSNPVSSLTKKQVSDYLLKKKAKWSNGMSVKPVDLGSKSSVRASVSKNIHKKSVSQVRAYWQQAMFSGKGSPPSEKKGDAAVINYVKTNKGALGYVSANANTSGVKVIKVN